jgi:hypothetical protein
VGQATRAGIMGGVMACPVAAARKLPGKRLGPSQSPSPATATGALGQRRSERTPRSASVHASALSCQPRRHKIA